MPKLPKAKSAEDRMKKGVYHDLHSKHDNGGVKVVEKGMQNAIKTPCAECPLRRDAAPGFLGGYSPGMYLEIMFSPASIACHSSPGFHDQVIETQRHCTGVAAFRANTGWVAGTHIELYDEIPYYATSHAHESTKIIGHDEETYFATPQEFVEYHTPGQRKAHEREAKRKHGTDQSHD